MAAAPEPSLKLLGGRLALDFVNSIPVGTELSWDRLIVFFEAARIATPERGGELLALRHSDPQAAEGLLTKAQHLGAGLR